MSADDEPTRLGPPDDDADLTLTAGPDPDATQLADGVVASSDDETRLEPGPPAARARGGTLQPGQALGKRYTIIKLLGVGGMGAVYQAWDAELNVAVAIKTILPDTRRDAGAARDLEKRFKSELLLARQVTHKNVVRIHDLGEIDGMKYITMPFLQGQTLGARMTEGALPVDEALAYTRQIADGLAAAHAAGVVHRDLKPDNIMIGPDGVVSIMDFGIAASTVEGGGAADSAVVGTLQYMAPEQATSTPVDQRADIYALGLILYDALTHRRRRGTAKTAIEELQQRSEQAPEALRAIVPEIPAALEAVVMRCLQPDREARYATTAELVADLARLDTHGQPLPLVRRLTRRMIAAATAAMILLLAGTYWATRRALEPPKQHDPVTVIVADIDNRTGDATFDRTLEPMLKRALEGASFVSAYDRTGIGRALGVRPPERMTEEAAREIAVKQGLGVVVAGSLERQGTGYRVAIKAVRPVNGEVVADEQARASSPDQVLTVATRLVGAVRRALGDDASESGQIFTMASLSATSLEVVRLYAAAQDAMSNNKFDEAREHAAKAIAIDPKFGIGYQLLAVSSRNMGKLQDAEKYINEALSHLDEMTERERYATRGMFYRVTGDYAQCVKEYGELIARYRADVVGHNQRALCLTQLRDMRGAVDEMRQVVQMLPKRALFRDNLALYANYSGDFKTGEQEARLVDPPDPYSLLALAFAQLGQDQRPQAQATYTTLASLGELGRSFAGSGLGDLASLEGRFSDAVSLLEQGAAAELAASNPDKAAAKFAAAGFARLQQGQPRAAAATADRALSYSKATKIRFLAGRIFAETGDPAKVRPLVASLGAELQAEPQAYAKILDALISLKSGDARQAIKTLTDANALLDTWIGHFDLGRAYLEAGAFPQADSEFDRCLKRRGEALALFLDEEPTYAFFPAVYYYQGRVREELRNAGAADSYRAYADIRGASTEDPLRPEVRKRAGRQRE